MAVVVFNRFFSHMIFLFAILAFGAAQPPGPPSTGTACDPCGSSASYSEAISTSGGYLKRTVTTTGCPNHYSYCTGKSGIPGCGAIGEEGTDTEATDQSRVAEIPASPVIASTTTNVECELGEIGIALNGVGIYSGAVNSNCDLVDVDDSTSEWTAFDFCSGHAQQTGDYHYHFPPSCLITQATASDAPSNGHSPQIGWAYDGFPIYGPLGVGGVSMTFTSNGCTGDNCLDECSGQESEIPALDNFKYRYYFTGSISDLYTLPTDPKPSTEDYPFSFGCYRGCTWATLSSGSCTGASGVTTSYVATATDGYTTPFTDFSDERKCGTSTEDSTPSGNSALRPAPSHLLTFAGFAASVCLYLFM
jgi:hypothetical protein